MNGYETPAISVSNNSNVDYRVSESTFKNNAIISIEKGSTLNAYEKLNSDRFGINFIVDGTFNYKNSAIDLGKTKITGTFSAQYITFKSGSSKLSGNGVINAAGAIEVDGNSTLEISDNATVKLTKETAAVKSRMIIKTTGTLIISAKNALSYEDGLADIFVSGAMDAKLTISADNKFNQLRFNRQDRNEKLTLTVNNGARVYFNSIEFQSYTTNTATLIIKNFAEYSIFFKDISNWDELESVTLSDTEGNTYTKDDLKWIKGNYDGVQGYWLSTVPEPAAYAAVFGALALAFAIYRRRK